MVPPSDAALQRLLGQLERVILPWIGGDDRQAHGERARVIEVSGADSCPRGKRQGQVRRGEDDVGAARSLAAAAKDEVVANERRFQQTRRRLRQNVNQQLAGGCLPVRIREVIVELIVAEKPRVRRVGERSAARDSLDETHAVGSRHIPRDRQWQVVRITGGIEDERHINVERIVRVHRIGVAGSNWRLFGLDDRQRGDRACLLYTSRCV